MVDHPQLFALEMSRSNLVIAVGLERIAIGSTGYYPYTVGSMAEATVTDQAASIPWWRGSSPRNLHEDVLFNILAAVDHARSVTWILRRPQRPSVSLATVTRGALEALSRAYWILDAPTPSERFVRHSQLAFHDAAEAVAARAYNTRYTHDGITVSPQQLMDEIREYLKLLGATPGNKPGAHQLLLTLLDAMDTQGTTTENERREVYSTLSAVAHGQSFAIQGFVQMHRTPEGSASHIRLEIDKRTIEEYAAYVYGCSGVVGEQLIRYFQPSQRFVEEWHKAMVHARNIRANAT
jgi:hypothetical protein